MTTDLAAIIGPDLAGDLYVHQAAEVEAAVIENADGVRRLAAQLTADHSITSPVAVLLSRIRKGQHRRYTPPAQRSTTSALDRAEGAYHRKLAHYAEHHALHEYDQEAALDFALTHTTGLTMEAEPELRQRLGLTPRPERAPEPPLTWSKLMATDQAQWP
jgi:hypothetical protein